MFEPAEASTATAIAPAERAYDRRDHRASACTQGKQSDRQAYVALGPSYVVLKLVANIVLFVVLGALLALT